MRSQCERYIGRGAKTKNLQHAPAEVAVTSLERRITELEQFANAQSRELRIQFERIAQLQAEWDILRIRSGKS
jgi:hypothetical protein